MWGLFSFFLRRMGSSHADSERRVRRRPLHTFGKTLIEISHKAYAKAQDYNGPLSTVLKIFIIVLKLATPIIYIMEYQWLAGLYFADSNILAIENIIEKFLPPSGYVFDKVDDLVQFAEKLPERFDDAMKDFPENIHIIPFLDRVIVYAISWLNCLVSTLSYWGTEGTTEREITIDDNCVKSMSTVESGDLLVNTKSMSTAESRDPSESHGLGSRIPSESHGLGSGKVATEMAGTAPESGSESPRSPTYKEALTNGARNMESEKKLEEDKEVQKDNVIGIYKQAPPKEREGESEHDYSSKKMTLSAYDDKNQSGSVEEEKKINETVPESDPILELFESAWLRKGSAVRKGPGEKAK